MKKIITLATTAFAYIAAADAATTGDQAQKIVDMIDFDSIEKNIKEDITRELENKMLRDKIE